MKQVTHWEERNPNNRTQEIQVMAYAALLAPLHPGKNLKSFAKMGEDNSHHTGRAEHL